MRTLAREKTQPLEMKLVAFSSPPARPAPSRLEIETVLVGAGAGAAAWLILRLFPSLEIEAFARGAAWLVSIFSGAPLTRVGDDWALAGGGRPVVVTAACSATGFFVILSALAGWQLARRWSSGPRSARRGRRASIIGITPFVAAGAALCSAALLAVLVNAMRIIAVTAAHRWVIPRFPENYGAFLHMFTGMAVFLPALIAINGMLEIHGRSRPRTASH